MASITFNCPNCGQKLSADKTLSESVTLCPVCEQTIRIPEFHLYPGMKVGDFVLRERLGLGGMGEVWLAEQSSMQRLTALKILSPSLSGNQEFCTRFQYEAKNSGKLSHPNIVTAFYAGIEDEIHYLAMSYIDGITLDTELEINKKLPEEQALQITQEVAEALKYAWDNFKIIHRDIKPSNIMLCRDGAVKLLDLGISKSLADHDTVTRTGIFVGTPYYISPEQARNDPDTDCQADIYSLGAVLYHMLTGDVPFNATTPMGVIARHLTEPLPDLRIHHQQISEPVRLLMEKMLKKKKTERFPCWDEVIAEIRKIRHHERLPVVRTEHFLARHQKVLLVIGAAFATLALISLLFKVIRDWPASPPAPATGLENELEAASPVLSVDKAAVPVNTAAPAESQPQSTVTVEELPPIQQIKPASSKTKTFPPAEEREIRPAMTRPNQSRPGLLQGINELQHMRRYLDLTPEQLQKVVEIMQDGRTRMNALREKLPYADVSYKEKLHQEMNKVRQDAMRQIKEILTEEQRLKFQDMEKMRRRLMDNAGGQPLRPNDRK